MKRYKLAWVAILLVVISSLIASANADITLVTTDIVIEGRDITELTIHELTTLESIVSMRIHAVQVETGEAFGTGIYTVGKNLSEGLSRVSVTSRSNTDLFTIVSIDGTASGAITHFVGMTELAEESFLFLFREGQTVTIAGDPVLIAPYK